MERGRLVKNTEICMRSQHTRCIRLCQYHEDTLMQTAFTSPALVSADHETCHRFALHKVFKHVRAWTG